MREGKLLGEVLRSSGATFISSRCGSGDNEYRLGFNTVFWNEFPELFKGFRLNGKEINELDLIDFIRSYKVNRSFVKDNNGTLVEVPEGLPLCKNCKFYNSVSFTTFCSSDTYNTVIDPVNGTNQTFKTNCLACRLDININGCGIFGDRYEE